jgi:hypothetical protein
MKTDIEKQWRHLTTAQLLLLFLFLCAWPIFWAMDRYLGGIATFAGKAILITWIGLFVLDAGFVYFWRCPRCGEPFNSGFFDRTPYRRKCQHCKLPRGATQY